MKVLQIYKTYYPDTFGGVEQVIKTISQETTKLGAQHTLLTVSTEARKDNIEGLPVIRYRNNLEVASCPFSFGFFNNFKRIARNFDLLHFHYPWPFADLTDLLCSVNCPSLVTFHADALKHQFLKKLYAPIQKRFLQKVDAIIPTSLPLMQNSKDLYSFQNKCHVIPIGIDPAAYPQNSPHLMQKWKNQLGQDFALFVGVLRHYKGLHTLVDAAKYITSPIVIAGSGPLELELKEHAKRIKANNIHFLGRISEEDKVALLTLCNVVILPSNSRSEAFGISLLEGLMYRKPLISTELGTGTSYVNQHEKTGFVIKFGDTAALVSAMQALQDQNLAHKMGETGYAWFMQEFQSAIMGQRYFNLYQQLLL